MAKARVPARGVGPVLWLTAMLVVLAGVALFVASRDTRSGSTYPDYSIRRTDDRGAALAYRIYERAGLKPQVWDTAFTTLKKPGLMIMVAPEAQRRIFRDQLAIGNQGDVLPHEMKALDAWVRQGNTVVVLSREPNSVFQALGLIQDEPKGISGAPAEPAAPSALAVGVEKVSTQTQFGFKFGEQKDTDGNPFTASSAGPSPVGTIPVEEWNELFVKKDAQRTVPQVVSAARGRGLYVMVNDHFPAGNLGITLADNLTFVVNLARLNPPGGTIWFDEYHKREVDRSLVAYLRERSLAGALIYGVLLLGLLFWRTGSRFGPLEPLVADGRRDSSEYIKAVASLYRNAGMPREALATIFADFRKRLAGALRVDGLTDLDEVCRRYEIRTGRPGVEARQVLIDTEAALARPKFSDQEALQFCAALTALDESLHRRAVSDEKLRA